MKKYTFPQLFTLLAMPVLTTLVGLILLLSPDTASALVGKLVGWFCIVTAISMIAGNRGEHRILWAIFFLLTGIWMLGNPLSIAKFLGRILGITLMIRGAHGLKAANLRSAGQQTTGFARTGALLTLITGVVLIFLPLASSRLLFKLVGIVMIGLGAAEAVSRIRGRKRLDGGDDPNIIDVEKL